MLEPKLILRSYSYLVTKTKNHQTMLVYLLLAYSLVASFLVVFGTFKEENDALYGLVLWKELKSHGFDALHSWSYAADSFLFPLLIIQIPFFLITNDATWSPILVGYLIFVGQALIVGMMVARRYPKQIAILSIAILLSLNEFVHTQMSASYATSHNISNLIGLATIFIVSAERRSRFYLKEFLVFTILTITAISDPWTIAIYTLPITATLIYFSVIPGSKTAKKGMLLLLAMLSFVLSKTNAFGLVSFLPPNELDIKTRFKIIFVHRNLESLQNNFKVFQNSFKEVFISNEFIQMGQFQNVFFLTLICSATYVVIKYAIDGFTQKVQFSHAPVYASVSIAATFFAFLVGPTAGLKGSQWLVALPYAVFILITLRRKSLSRHEVKSRWLLIGTMWVFVYSSINIFNSSFDLSTIDEKTSSVVQFANREKQIYGFGSYWGTNANVIALETEGKVKIRPIRFDHESKRLIFQGRPATLDSWYSIDDLPRGESEIFFLISRDEEECQSLLVCKTIIAAQFGEPLRVAHLSDMVMMIYDVEILRNSWSH